MAESCHILIINQHGNNRGDDAAMRAMLRSLTERLADLRFSILHQFRGRRLAVELDEPVEELALILSPFEGLRLAVFVAGRWLGLSLFWVLGEEGRFIIRAYKRADLVISAPGGPNFGDIYWSHELVHWFYVAIAVLYQCPLFLYAPSAGPFRIRWLNPVRRALFRRFDKLCVREDLSASHLRELLGPDTEIEVTADSALQYRFSPFPRSDYFQDERLNLAERYIVAVSLIDYSYPRETHPEKLRDHYKEIVLGILRQITNQRDSHFLLLPQLYAKKLTDLEFLQEIGARLGDGFSWEIVDPSLDSNVQQRLFAMSDFHIASRYHPAIFGNAGLVPGICIYYEHKALGFMKQIGLERFAFDIRELSAPRISDAVNELIENRDAIRSHLKSVILGLRARAQRTSARAVEVLLAAKDTRTKGGPS